MDYQYMLGTNYWGRRYGTEMWLHYDGKEAREELKQLWSYGVRYLRVFPNWRDFQPVDRARAWQGTHGEYFNARTGEPVYNDGVDPDRIADFRDFCRAAEEIGIKLVVSIVTGWMSGRLFSPPALNDKNLINDPEAIMWMTRFIHRFVRELKNESAIVAWDLGNECNCLGKAENAFEAYEWTRAVVDSIRAEDTTRPIASGMHGLSSGNDAPWQVTHQGELCDILTTHPYPSPTVGGDNEPYTRLRMTFLPTAQSLYYSGVGGRPAYVQESGTFSQTLGSRQMSADFMRIQILSSLANGLCGYQWWCAWEQDHLNFAPYTWAMVERELGLFDKDGHPKPVAHVMKKMADVLDTLPNPFPKRAVDGVCLLSRGQAQQPVAIATLTLAKQAGLDLDVAYSENGDFPASNLYFMPDITGWQVIYKKTWDTLLSRVRNGATLYISYGGGQITDFPEIVGAESRGVLAGGNHTLRIGGREIAYSGKQILLTPKTAEVLAENEEKNPVLLKNQYGKGFVYFCNFSPEQIAFNTPDGFSACGFDKIYSTVAKETIAKKILCAEQSDLGVTLHPLKDGGYLATVLNYSDKEISPTLKLKNGFEIGEILYGKIDRIPPCDGVIFKLNKEKCK